MFGERMWYSFPLNSLNRNRYVGASADEVTLVIAGMGYLLLNSFQPNRIRLQTNTNDATMITEHTIAPININTIGTSSITDHHPPTVRARAVTSARYTPDHRDTGRSRFCYSSVCRYAPSASGPRSVQSHSSPGSYSYNPR